MSSPKSCRIGDLYREGEHYTMILENIKNFDPEKVKNFSFWTTKEVSSELFNHLEVNCIALNINIIDILKEIICELERKNGSE